MNEIIFKDYCFTISEKLAKRIKTTKDLNNLYAFLEEDLTEEEQLKVSYDFGDQVNRIDKLMNDLNYIVGKYDIKIIRKLLKD